MTFSLHRRSTRISGAIAVSSLLFAGSLGVSAPAALAVPTCDVAPAVGVTVTCTFNAGGFTDLVVPSGTASITMVAIGGSGGALAIPSPGIEWSGGSGARVSSSTAVAAGQTLSIYVGGGGLRQGAGGAGYGTGGNTGSYGGGGGGSSAVLLNGTVVTVAGGGGGGGGGGVGGTAGGAYGSGGNGQGPSEPWGTPGAGGSGGIGGVAVDAFGNPPASSGGGGYDAGGGRGSNGGGGAGSAGGAGGAGWGGGAGGGYPAISPSYETGGGGAGGSYGPMGTVFASAANATGDGLNGANGSVQITFNAASEGQLPPDVLQGVGAIAGNCTNIDRPDLNWGGSASGGWGRSWAQWSNDGLGGFVCLRTLRYDAVLLHWVVAQ